MNGATSEELEHLRSSKTTAETLEEALEARTKDKRRFVVLFLAATIPTIFIQMNLTSYVFLADTGDVWCDIPALSSTNWTNDEIIAISSPESDSTEHCTMYNWNYSSLSLLSYDDALDYVNHHTKPNIIKCQKYAYDEEFKSIVSEWDLVCDKTALKSTVQFLVPFGKFLGSAFAGLLADKFGRRIIFIICAILLILSSIACSFAPTYWALLLFRLLIGLGCGGYAISFTIVSEMASGKLRELASCLFNVTFGIGIIILPVIAYYTTSWRQLQFWISLPSLLLLINCWVIPESSRWLINQGQYEKAWKILMKTPFVKINQEEEKPEKSTDDTFFMKVMKSFAAFLQLFSNAQISYRSLICFVLWFVSGLGYYVLSLNGENLGVNEYLYVGLNGVAETPSYLVSFFLIHWLGRKLTGVISYGGVAVALFAVLIVPEGTPRMVVSITGRLFTCATYALLMLITTELFPTSLRNSAIGLSSTMTQMGAMSAPYITDLLGQIQWYIPSTICGAGMLIAVLMILLLPETAHKKLPEIMEDVENAPANMKVSIANCCTFGA